MKTNLSMKTKYLTFSASIIPVPLKSSHTNQSRASITHPFKQLGGRTTDQRPAAEVKNQTKKAAA
jgi:hypothetical protein